MSMPLRAVGTLARHRLHPGERPSHHPTPRARGSGSDLKRGALLSPAGVTQIHCHGIIAAWHAELDFIARQPGLVASIENRGPQNAQLVVLDAPRSCRRMPQVMDDQPTTAFEYLAPMAVVGDTFPHNLSTNFGCGEVAELICPGDTGDQSHRDEQRKAADTSPPRHESVQIDRALQCITLSALVPNVRHPLHPAQKSSSERHHEPHNEAQSGGDPEGAQYPEFQPKQATRRNHRQRQRAQIDAGRNGKIQCKRTDLQRAMVVKQNMQREPDGEVRRRPRWR